MSSSCKRPCSCRCDEISGCGPIPSLQANPTPHRSCSTLHLSTNGRSTAARRRFPNSRDRSLFTFALCPFTDATNKLGQSCPAPAKTFVSHSLGHVDAQAAHSCIVGDALAACLQASDCVLIERNKPSECLRSPLYETLPTRCQQLKRGYGECKRGMVDMRKRFRGNQPIALSKELEGGSGSGGGQLYAGNPVIGKTPGTTDGRDDLAESEGNR